MKLNPYEQGVADYHNNLRGCNPFPTFTQKWALYNRGFNSASGWPSGKQPSTMADWREANPNPTHGCGHMQGRGAA